jgi:hypothetical protein
MPQVPVAGKLYPRGIALLNAAPGVTFDYVEDVPEAIYALSYLQQMALSSRHTPCRRPRLRGPNVPYRFPPRRRLRCRRSSVTGQQEHRPLDSGRCELDIGGRAGDDAVDRTDELASAAARVLGLMKASSVVPATGLASTISRTAGLGAIAGKRLEPFGFCSGHNRGRTQGLPPVVTRDEQLCRSPA